MDRRKLLIGQLDTNGRGLEIGPSYNPLLPKSQGYRVESVDYADAPALRAKYASATTVDITRIEEVDHIVRGGSILETVQRPGHYDYIVASHVIEHTPDMLGFLKDCQSLLKPTGRLVLAVPDKRCCFDVFQPPSSTGAVLQAHLEKRAKPGIGAIFDDRAYNAVRDGLSGWALEEKGGLRFFLDMDQVRALYRDALAESGYTDVHVWKFVPSSFRLIINDLNEIGALALFEQWFLAGADEFYVTLGGAGTRPEMDRLAMMQEAWVEHAEGKNVLF